MKRVLLSLAVTVLMAASVQATPSLGFWDEGALGATHARWDFTPGYVSVIPNGYNAIPEQVTNPNPGFVALHISAPAVWDGQTVISGSVIVLDIKLPNYPQLNTYKDLWVDLGLNQGSTFIASVDPLPHTVTFTQELLRPQGDADFGIRILPNPEFEDVLVVIQGPAGAAALLDYVHVDTICIPAPAALLLAGLGTGTVGWLRRRRAL